MNRTQPNSEPLPFDIREALRQLRRDEMWTGMRTENSRAASERTDLLVEHIVAMYESALKREELLRRSLAALPTPAGARGTNPTEEPMRDLSRLAGNGLQRSIAADVWPHGAILSCKKCRYSTRITTEEAGRYLASGWPKHCGATMTCDAASAVPTAGARGTEEGNHD